MAIEPAGDDEMAISFPVELAGVARRSQRQSSSAKSLWLPFWRSAPM